MLLNSSGNKLKRYFCINDLIQTELPWSKKSIELTDTWNIKDSEKEEDPDDAAKRLGKIISDAWKFICRRIYSFLDHWIKWISDRSKFQRQQDHYYECYFTRHSDWVFNSGSMALAWGHIFPHNKFVYISLITRVPINDNGSSVETDIFWYLLHWAMASTYDE